MYGGIFCEEILAAPEDPDPGRAERLVAGERHEVGPEFLDVDPPVGRGLRRIDDHERPGGRGRGPRSPGSD